MANHSLSVLLILPNDPEGQGALLLQILLQDVTRSKVTTLVAPTFTSALDLLEQGVGDIALICSSFEADGDFERLAAIRRVSPEVPLVVIADTVERDLAWRVIEVGADDCLLKVEVSSAALTRSLRYALDHRRHTSALARLERYDPRTGLLAHRALFSVLERFHRRCRQGGSFSFAVLVVGIVDHGALVHRCGHFVVEEVMARVANRLEDAARPGDVVARLGDDGFVLVLPAVGQRHEAESVAGRLRRRFREPLRIRDIELQLTLRTGLALSGPRVEEAAYDGPHDMLGAAVLDSKLSLPALGLATAELN